MHELTAAGQTTDSQPRVMHAPIKHRVSCLFTDIYPPCDNLVDDLGYCRACTCIILWVFVVADLHAVYVCMKQQEKVGSFGSLITANSRI